MKTFTISVFFSQSQLLTDVTVFCEGRVCILANLVWRVDEKLMYFRIALYMA